MIEYPYPEASRSDGSGSSLAPGLSKLHLLQANQGVHFEDEYHCGGKGKLQEQASEEIGEHHQQVYSQAFY